MNEKEAANLEVNLAGLIHHKHDGALLGANDFTLVLNTNPERFLKDGSKTFLQGQQEHACHQRRDRKA
jgi:hypothetical protein